MQVGDRAALHTQQRASGVDASAIAPAWEATKDAAAAAGSGGTWPWLLVALDPSKKDTLVVREQGASGGFAAARAALKDDEVLFGAAPFGVGSGASSAATRRFFFFTAVGHGVGGLKRARVSMQKQAVYNAFGGVVADVMGLDPAVDLEPEAVRAAIAKQAGGGVGPDGVLLE